MYREHFSLLQNDRSDIFELFDIMMLLSQGKMVYFGKQNELVNYFTRMGYPCPELTNPCDYYGNSKSQQFNLLKANSFSKQM